jgi:hypothetical protein
LLPDKVTCYFVRRISYKGFIEIAEQKLKMKAKRFFLGLLKESNLPYFSEEKQL